LDPHQKYKYFEKKWREEDIPAMKEKMEGMYEEFSENSQNSDYIPNSEKLSDLDINA
jgi:hypothetical protein